MSYFNPDPTGTLSTHTLPPTQYKIARSDTGKYPIEFGRSVFLDTIKVTKLGTINTEIEQDDGWSAGDIDYTSMAQISANLDPTFDRKLVTGIVVDTGIEAFVISITCQCLYPVRMGSSLVSNERVELNPGLITEIINRLNYVESMASSMSSTLASTTAVAKLLPEDPTMTNADNYITSESHIINTYSNIRTIRPACGAFFPDNLIVQREGYPTPLVLGTDYMIFGCDIPRTRITSNPKGVYRYIRILADFAGTVKISYRAYGGEVTFSDVSLLNDKITNIDEYLSENTFLTTGGLSDVPIIQAMQQKILDVEEELRQLVSSGTATYGDSTNGKFVKQALKSTNTGLNWFNIAKLYQVAGSTDIITADRMQFRMSLVNAKIMADVVVGFNMSNTTEPFTLDVVSLNMSKGYTAFTDYSGLSNVIRPQFRIIYNKTVGTGSGAYLQLGIPMPTLSEIVGLEDRSGTQSCWILLDAVSGGMSPANSSVTLPNATYIWDKTNVDSVQLIKQLPYRDGWLAYGGAINVASLLGAGTTNFTNVIGPYFDISSIRRIRLELTDSANTGAIYEFKGRYDVTNKEADVMIVSPSGKVANLEIKLSQDATSTIIAVTVTGEVDATLSLAHIFFEV